MSSVRVSVRPVIPLKVRSGKKMERRKENRRWNGRESKMEWRKERKDGWRAGIGDGGRKRRRKWEREGGVVEYVYVCVVNELISCLLSFFSFFLFISCGSGFILVGL